MKDRCVADDQETHLSPKKKKKKVFSSVMTVIETVVIQPSFSLPGRGVIGNLTCFRHVFIVIADLQS